MKKGIAESIASAFITSKLSILLTISCLLLGIYSLSFIPREEEPQIDVPIVDIMIGFPGADPAEVEAGLVKPLEKLISNIIGVEHIYSVVMDNQAMITTQFYVGENMEVSLVKLYNEIIKNMDKMPQGVTMPLIKNRAIDDVPILTFTLWSETVDDFQIRQVAEVVADEIKKIPDVAQTNIVGGRSRQIRVVLDKEKLSENNLDFLTVSQFIQANNVQANVGNVVTANSVFVLQLNSFFKNIYDVENLIIGTKNNHPIYLKQIAEIVDGPSLPDNYVSFGYGKAYEEKQNNFPDEYSAVSISVAKKNGADAMRLAETIQGKINHLGGDLLSNDINLEVTRNYGESASEKVNELFSHLGMAILAVTLFVMLTMGWRGGLVVFLSVPVTFSLTLFAYYFFGYTLNRITLFALVLVVGIVVDDSIIIAENMHRHFKMRKLPFYEAALYSIKEVGNPTILATLTVIASILPMAFVSGMMGPYMSPMPTGASMAMIFSLLVALTITPYFGYKFLRFKNDKEEEFVEETDGIEQKKLYKIYAALMNPLLNNRRNRWVFILGITFLLFASMGLFYTKDVAVKMLPFDNKNELQVIIDLPEGTTLETTSALTKELTLYLRENELVTTYQTYAGVASPINFNGLVRHYDYRNKENVADIQVNITHKNDRKLQSHDFAKEIRNPLQKIGEKYNANIKVVEIPPGPPVMSTVVAEIYGPDYNTQISIASQVMGLMKQTDNLTDIDWSVEDDQEQYRFIVDREKAMKMGVPAAMILQNLHGAISGMPVGTLHGSLSSFQPNILLQLPERDKADINNILNLKVQNSYGQGVPLSELVDIQKGIAPKSIQRKDQKRVVFVLAEVAGELESPIYAINAISERLGEVSLPAGYSISEEYMEQPLLEDDYTLKWDGEWQITYEVFRDLGFAFMIVLVIIYILLVAWFHNFTTPLIQLAAIPLSLLGIIVGHWVLGAYFSAPSMIGFIALAGIMVRNSILLIDFIDIRLKDNIPLKKAILESGAIRAMPIILTSATIIMGTVTILFDPIFQGLAISLMSGTIASTVLTVFVVPLLYYKYLKKKVN